MKINQEAETLIKDFEGLRLNAYQCSAGVWTIGWGHTRGVKKGDKITREKAEELFREDIPVFEKIVEDAVKVPLNENQFSALVSFCFNVGPGKKGVKDGFVTLKNGNPSTMLRKLNAGDYTGAASQFHSWINAAGKPSNGLVRRRKAEAQLFLKP